MKNYLLILSLSLAIPVFLFSCSKTADAGSNNAAVDCSDGIKSFVADVNPIIQSTCVVRLIPVVMLPAAAREP
jgi:hypothetical protein